MSANTRTTTIDLTLPLVALASLVTILLAVAKFSNLITIPWLWVFSPFWLPLAFGLSVGLLIALVVVVIAVVGLLIMLVALIVTSIMEWSYSR